MSASAASGPSSSDSAPTHAHQVSVSEEHHLTLSVDFDAVLSQPDLKLSFPIVVPGFAQEWSLYCQHEHTQDEYTFGLSHPLMPPGHIGNVGRGALDFAWLDRDIARPLVHTSWADLPAPAFDEDAELAYNGYRLLWTSGKVAEQVNANHNRLDRSKGQRYRLSVSLVQVGPMGDAWLQSRASRVPSESAFDIRIDPCCFT